MTRDPAAETPDGLSTQLKYLTDAAHLMAFRAPSCSSHLMSICNLITFSNDIKQSDSHRRHICGGCGNIMIPGWTSAVKNEVQRQQYKKKGHKKTEGVKTHLTKSSIVNTCDRCRRETRHIINRVASPRMNPQHGVQAQPDHGLSPECPPAPVQLQARTPAVLSANASSKKRAKTRKQGSLQTLLAKSKETPQSSNGGFGLDLLDILKHG